MSCPATSRPPQDMKWWIPVGKNPEQVLYCDYCVKAGLVKDQGELYQWQGGYLADALCDCPKNPPSLALERWHQKIENRPTKEGSYVLEICPRGDPYGCYLDCCYYMNLKKEGWTLSDYVASHPRAKPLVYKASTADELLPNKEDKEMLEFVNYTLTHIGKKLTSVEQDQLRKNISLLQELLQKYNGTEVIETTSRYSSLYNEPSTRKEIIKAMKAIIKQLS